MSAPNFTVPDELNDELHYVPSADTRSDDEIIRDLSEYAPVTSEKNIWAYWHSGIKSMPAWCQRNVANWVRLCGPSWNVRVLDNVPGSPSNALKYLPAEMLPTCFVKGTMDGPYTGPHSADFLRGACLTQHGGVFMDVGIILIRDLDRLCWNQLADPNSPFQISIPWMFGLTVANHFVASRKGDPFIKRWHELFVHLWDNHNNHEGVISNPLMDLGVEMSFDDLRQGSFTWDFSVDARTVYEYVAQILAWTRLCMLEEAGDGFSCTDYWQKNVLLFDSLKECWGVEEMLGFAGAGQKMLDLLSLSLSADKSSEEYQQAQKLVWRLLTKSSLQKITHGKGLTTSVHLGTLWDMPENEGKDCAPGTFAELLRFGTVHFAQNRETIACEKALPPPKTMKKGVLEP